MNSQTANVLDFDLISSSIMDERALKIMVTFLTIIWNTLKLI